MDTNTLRKVTELQEQIWNLEEFLSYCKISRRIKFYKKKRSLVVEVHDYMMATKLFELPPRARENFIVMLEQELDELRKEFSELGMGGLI